MFFGTQCTTAVQELHGTVVYNSKT